MLRFIEANQSNVFADFSKVNANAFEKDYIIIVSPNGYYIPLVIHMQWKLADALWYLKVIIVIVKLFWIHHLCFLET